MRHCR